MKIYKEVTFAATTDFDPNKKYQLKYLADGVNWLNDKHEIWSSVWFVLTVMVLASVVHTAALILLDAVINLHVVLYWTQFSGVDLAGALDLFTAVASSMVTMAGIVFFSILIACCSTSSQYMSHIICYFIWDQGNQFVLCLFVAIFAYGLLVFKIIREGENGVFIQMWTLLPGLFLVFIGVVFFIYSIHYISMSIKVLDSLPLKQKDTHYKFFSNKNESINPENFIKI